MLLAHELTDVVDWARHLRKTYWGKPRGRFLWAWIEPVGWQDLIDLAQMVPAAVLPARLDQPLTVRNWLATATTYATDPELYGMPEFWADPAFTLESGKGDCEDLNGLACSVLYSQGVPRVRLCVGHHGEGDPTEVNHAWGMWFPREGTDDPLVIETTGNAPVASLLPLSACPEYNPLAMGERLFLKGGVETKGRGRIWLCNQWAEAA